MTGDPKMSAQAYLEYFAPLEEWLDEYIEAHNLTVGWDTPDYSTLCRANTDDIEGSCNIDTC